MTVRPASRFAGLFFLAAALAAVRGAAEEVAFSTPTADVPAVAAGPGAPLFAVRVPVADLRAEPKRVDGASALKNPYPADALQESQLLYGERVKILEEKAGWARVEAVEQPEFTHADAWTGYPGWVLRDDLTRSPVDGETNAVVSVRYAKMTSLPSRKESGVLIPAGTRLLVTFQKDEWLRVLRPEGGDGWFHRGDLTLAADLPSAEDARRESILTTARIYLDEPYFWGGRAGHRLDDVSRPSGMDCSGLVNIAYRVAGIDVPRDAHEQYMKSYPLSSPAELKPGDLIFLAWEKNPGRITHVMIYERGDDVLEAVQEADRVRRVSVREKLGRLLREISVLEPVGGRFVYFGRLLPE